MSNSQLNQYFFQQFVSNPLYDNLYAKYKDNPRIIPDEEWEQTISILRQKKKGMDGIRFICFKYKYTGGLYNFKGYDDLLRNMVTDYLHSL